MKLVLFDVDGVLIPTGSLGFDYWKVVVKKYFGFDINSGDIYTEGKTDRMILAEHLKRNGIKDPENDKRFNEALEAIGDIVAEGIKGRKLERIPNVENLIKSLLERKDVVVGLLTGNVYEKARIKLEIAGLWKYFKVGAFGEKTTIRSELVSVALEDAKRKTGIDFRKDEVYLIGDTIRDIRCAKEAGVKIIAVATGKETPEQLEKEQPDYLFKDFSNIEKIMDAIG